MKFGLNPSHRFQEKQIQTNNGKGVGNLTSDSTKWFAEKKTGVNSSSAWFFFKFGLLDVFFQVFFWQKKLVWIGELLPGYKNFKISQHLVNWTHKAKFITISSNDESSGVERKMVFWSRRYLKLFHNLRSAPIKTCVVIQTFVYVQLGLVEFMRYNSFHEIDLWKWDLTLWIRSWSSCSFS